MPCTISYVEAQLGWARHAGALADSGSSVQVTSLGDSDNTASGYSEEGGAVGGGCSGWG